MARFAVALVLVAFIAATAASVASATIYFNEDFSSLNGWVTSKHKSDYGEVKLGSGKNYGDKAINQGLQLTQDAHFYAVSKKIDTPVDNKDKDIVISFSLKNEQKLTCGGGYIKVLPSIDPTAFNGDSNYWLMFGPDLCGSKNKIHIILHHNGVNYEWTKNTAYPADQLTHVYTLRIAPDNTYELYVDNEKRNSGSIASEWKMLPPETIPDPNEKKPADWVDEAKIPDPEDKKPEDWDSIPAEIPDPEAARPDDWDDEEDGEWEAPMIPNPEYKGTWTPRMIPNPEYKGVWKAQEIPNPEYKVDNELYHVHAPLEYVGIDVWQVESGSIFDNIIIGDNYDEVKAIIDATYGATAEKEKTQLDASNKAAEEAAKKAEAEGAAAGEGDEEAEGDL